jgi:hypothetical protein
MKSRDEPLDVATSQTYSLNLVLPHQVQVPQSGS